MQRILFITGKLAAPALRRTVEELGSRHGFNSEVAVLPITVAALLTTDWIGRHFQPQAHYDRVILPGFCRGNLADLHFPETLSVELGPRDLRDLPEFFGQAKRTPLKLDRYDIEILAEINHAPQLSCQQIVELAAEYRTAGANIIDVGCDPGTTWAELPTAIAALISAGHRVSVDSFNPIEVESALAAGATIVLSVNSKNRHLTPNWRSLQPLLEVVAIPDSPTDFASLNETVHYLKQQQICHRIDPILEPIGFGFAASLGRYLQVRQMHPDAEILMGVGNLTELTDVDSAGLNVLLAGFCQEIGIRSVLTTQVVHWSRSSIREFDLARRLVHYAVREKTLPKRVMTELLLLRDARVPNLGEERLQELAQQVTDRNYRIFAERGEIHVINGMMYLHGSDPFEIFQQLWQLDAKLDPSHAFYLGYELAKAKTALTLDKHYQQDRALHWGFLTIPEKNESL